MRPSRVISKCILGCPRYFRTCAIITVAIFIIESLIFNTIILYFVFNLGSTISNIIQAPGATLIDKLAVDPVFQGLVNSGKAGGFKALLQHTLGRVYILDDSCSPLLSQNDSKTCQLEYPKVHSIGIDVSGAGEVMYIYRRMQRYTNKPWIPLIVDIGANDGLLSSNSYNFIQWGWSAILVEPQASQLELASVNLRSVNTHPGQHVEFVQAVMGDIDGSVRFKLSHDIVSMESHVVNRGRLESTDKDDILVQVDSYTVRTFAKKYKVPKNFGILSIDAEGAGSKILHQWIYQGFRPAYIIYEALHDPENIHVTIQRLEHEGYTFLTKLGWNSIFEYNFDK